MKAGQLQFLLYHYRRVPGQDDMGEIDPTFVLVPPAHPVGLLPVNLKQSGDEMFVTAHVAERIDRHFQTRYGGITGDDRIEVQGVMYRVLAVYDPDGNHAEFQLKCKLVE